MLDVSIIIPFQKISPYLSETLDAISRLKDANFEVILLPDIDIGNSILENYDFPVHVVTTGKVSPAIKRDQGASESKGRYLAFIDDDAYPAPDWLKKAMTNFEDENIVAIGGPQITPEHDGFWQKASGAMFLSPLNGKAVCRYTPCNKKFYVDDWPSVNLIVKKDVFLKVGGFDNSYWPGEDTKLCADLIQLGKKIIYEPEAMVFHHRRGSFLKHIKQIGNYGLHRGYFAKRFPSTSRKISYAIPSCFWLFVCFGWLLILLGSIFHYLYLLFWLIYTSALLISTIAIIKKTDLKIAIASIPYLIATHFWYGWRFILGFIFVKDLKSKLGR